MINVVSVSGGKDSTALWLWARRTGIPNLLPMFSDTGWEAKQTYEYLRLLEERLGPIRRAIPKRDFKEGVRYHGCFPRSNAAWCTTELKIEPFAAQLDLIREETDDDVQVLVGVRRDESRKRENLTEREHSDVYDCDVVRPLLDWTLEMVVAEHHLAGIPLNPLYHAGAERVGCWPCRHAGKAEIAMVYRMSPERIAEIRELEIETEGTMFAKEAPVAERVPGEPRKELPLPIDEATAWARTSRGGKHLLLFAEPSGCPKWGICEAPVRDRNRGTDE